ncbi:MAG: hypothetical protein G01um101448_20 [Parcubacteria group bacterium Gr01-1014_48]|nr:MAG: hypothetical protein Greene041614_382 [Parcubacteria group bacterium Greene0416_14]TSC74605.1 MAG: hypothetical protein G01um101448_20 [Parcubacteria group bacterium Gr01-1014_48]TSD01596.1 MAG: hypothetical protein Greene101415_176 [Parcubacteria group bacterium Greene1014_15]TSD08355.1 MAG: hypothetical protein Greene07144_150 [Parcubacteria group bacterium Greene0714_4]
MIRILQRLDAGATVVEILKDLPEENREEARELLYVIMLLDSVREHLPVPHEHFEHILQRLDDPIPGRIPEKVTKHTHEKKASAEHIVSPKAPKIFVMPHIPTVFHLQKYFFPLSTAVAVVVLLVVSRQYVTSEPIGTDAVLFELSTEYPLDTFPDDEVIPSSAVSAQETASIPAETLPHFDILTEAPVVPTTLNADNANADQKHALSSRGVSSTPQASRGTLFDESLETTLTPLIKNESSDAYGVFPEDTFSIYLQTLTDIPIDHY